LYAVAAMALVGAMAVTVLAVVALAATKHRAGAAADLAALAGATALRSGADPCAAAADVANRNGAVLTECSKEVDSVTVSVTARSPRLVGVVLDLPGRARAGWG
jgi:secretion/DNA translocation related TadE-like protein